jgi:hypothetical protein
MHRNQKEAHMSYRNDHDAALSRVDALEHELAQLRRERSGERSKPRRGRKVFGVIAVGVVCAAAMAWTRGDKTVPAAEVPAVKIAMTSDPCAGPIEERAARDAKAADPRTVGHRSAIEVMRGAAICGPREAVPSAAEENVSSLITVYYDGDPVALDGYATAEQLWREFHRARAARAPKS